MVLSVSPQLTLRDWIPQMFVSFFPRPKLFFLSAILWTALSMAFWYGYASDLIGSSAPEGVGVALFWSARSLWFDLYFALGVAVFAAAWMLFAPHPWAPWSILGSALILFTSYFQVQVSVAIALVAVVAGVMTRFFVSQA